MSANSDDDAGPAWPPAAWTLKLRTPIADLAGSAIKDLALREPTDDEWVKIHAEPPETRRRRAVSIICGLEMATVAKIAIGDLVQAGEYLTAFFDVATAIRPWSQPSSPTSTAGPPAT